MKKKYLMSSFAAGVIVLVMGCTTIAAEIDLAYQGDERLEEWFSPVWEGNVIYNETVWPIAGEDGVIEDIPLLYDASDILSLTDFEQKVVYEEGTDYQLIDGKLHILDSGNIEITPDEIYHPETGFPTLVDENGRYNYMGYPESLDTSLKQICVTYSHEDVWEGIKPEGKSNLLPNTTEKLNNKEDLTIVYYGDSITEGYCASGTHPGSADENYVLVNPYQPGFAQLVTEYLSYMYPETEVTAYNTALSGMKSDWGVENVQDNVVKYNPDLVVIGFGMNDGTEKVSSEEFCNNVQEIMDAIRQTNSMCEFVLVSTMLPNPDIPVFYGTQETYAERMIEMEEAGVAVADMTSLHKQLLSAKRYVDMTGNNVNHPNDFLTRVYAQLLYLTITE